MKTLQLFCFVFALVLLYRTVYVFLNLALDFQTNIFVITLR